MLHPDVVFESPVVHTPQRGADITARGWNGNTLMHECAIYNRVDMAVSRDIRMGGTRNLEFRLDVFNVFNTVIITNRQNQVQYNSPTDLSLRNSQTLADGSIDPARIPPRNAGFGAATAAAALRSMQIQLRFSF